jgi:peptide/nickel transport system substrate-binding protein
MAINYKLLDTLRKGRSEHENNLIDGLVEGRVNRREFLRFGSVLGLSLPVLNTIAGAMGLSAAASDPALAQTLGGTIRIGLIVPAAAIEPVKLADGGGIITISQVAETLVVSGKDLVARPALAESWSPNEDGSIWTFKIRKGVKFHDGREMTAADVVASFERIADPANGSNALSALKGVLSKGGARKTDDYTVEFHLDAPNGGFPYTVSTDNYNAVIIPADYDGDFESKMIGTGAFKLESYTPKVGATFVRNENYWGGQVIPDRVEMVYYEDYQPQVLALQAGEIDLIREVPILKASGLLNDSNIDILSTPSVAHQQVHMRTDKAPFIDKRVRQAIALCLDRQAIVDGLMRGKAQVGNDSPFARAYPSSDQTVPQREKDIAKAKELMAAAGMADGFEVTLTTEKYIEIPEFAQIIQDSVKEIGGKINLNIMDQGAFYGDGVYGKSPWLDSDMGITDYGHRGVPNVYLSAPLLSEGPWNSAHFKNAEYDSLVASYVAALDLDAQKAIAGKIQTLLLEETPIIFAYFYDVISAAKKGLKNVEMTAMGQLFLQNASI